MPGGVFALLDPHQGHSLKAILHPGALALGNLRTQRVVPSMRLGPLEGGTKAQEHGHYLPYSGHLKQRAMRAQTSKVNHVQSCASWMLAAHDNGPGQPTRAQQALNMHFGLERQEGSHRHRRYRPVHCFPEGERCGRMSEIWASRNDLH